MALLLSLQSCGALRSANQTAAVAASSLRLLQLPPLLLPAAASVAEAAAAAAAAARDAVAATAAADTAALRNRCRLGKGSQRSGLRSTQSDLLAGWPLHWLPSDAALPQKNGLTLFRTLFLGSSTRMVHRLASRRAPLALVLRIER